MAKFKLPPISPLIGSTPGSYFQTLRGRKIESPHYMKTTLTTVVVFIAALFQWYEKIYDYFRLKNYRIPSEPVFIIGHWRTGTTYLHNLLSQDPQMGFVTTYQSVFPNNLKSKFLFRTFMRSQIPEKRPGDNVRLNVGYPQEDEFALSNITPMNYYQFMYFPLYYEEYYEKTIRFSGITELQRSKWKKDYLRMVKKAICNSGGDIPLLKNPCLSGRLPVLTEMYPGSKYIFIMRNPVIVFLSSRKFFSELLPTLWFHRITNEELDEMIFSTFVKLIEDYERSKHLVPPENLIEIKFEDYEEAPLDFLSRVYRQFEIPDFNQAKPVFSEYIRKMSGYRKNTYRISKELLDRILDRWGFAMKLWDYEVPDNLEIK